jgi:hypothetical protein
MSIGSWILASLAVPEERELLAERVGAADHAVEPDLLDRARQVGVELLGVGRRGLIELVEQSIDRALVAQLEPVVRVLGGDAEPRAAEKVTDRRVPFEQLSHAPRILAQKGGG